MSGKMLLSFVIPVYNVEKYLNECLDSIFDQSADESDYEIIAVDDGSTDRSPEILKTYLRNNNFMLITQENRGAGAARNAGIRAARGRYIYFVDSDDYILPGTLSMLLGYVTNSDCDVIEFRAQKVDERGNYVSESEKTVKINPYSGTGKDALVSWYKSDALSIGPCTRILRRSFIIENALYFHEQILPEDIDWNYRLFFCAKTVFYYPQMVYSYRRRPNSSVTEKNDLKRCFNCMPFVDALLELRNSIECNDENFQFISVLGDQIASHLEMIINIFCKSSSLGKHRKAIFLELKKRRPLLGLATRPRGWLLYRLTRFMPTIVAFRMYKHM